MSGTTNPPTMDDVLLCVAAMRDRIACGHSTPDQPMARLSLAMTDVLLSQLEHHRRRLIALRQAIPTLDHETSLDAVARLLRERDDAVEGVAAGRRAAQSAARMHAALLEIERLCGGTDDSPRAGVERVIRERDEARAAAARLRATARVLIDAECQAWISEPTTYPPSSELVDLSLAADAVPTDWTPSDDGEGEK